MKPEIGYARAAIATATAEACEANGWTDAARFFVNKAVCLLADATKELAVEMQRSQNHQHTPVEFYSDAFTEPLLAKCGECGETLNVSANYLESLYGRSRDP